MKCRVGELGFDSVLFRWLKVSLMIREAACQSILSSPSAMLGCSATRVRGWYDGCDKPFFETSQLEVVRGSSLPWYGADRTTIGKCWLHFMCSRTVFRRDPTFTGMTSCKSTRQLELTERKVPVVIREVSLQAGVVVLSQTSPIHLVQKCLTRPLSRQAMR